MKITRRIFEQYSSTGDCINRCKTANVAKHDYGWYSRWRVSCLCGQVEWYISWVEEREEEIFKYKVRKSRENKFEKINKNSFINELIGIESFIVIKNSNWFDWC